MEADELLQVLLAQRNQPRAGSGQKPEAVAAGAAQLLQAPPPQPGVGTLGRWVGGLGPCMRLVRTWVQAAGSRVHAAQLQFQTSRLSSG